MKNLLVLNKKTIAKLNEDKLTALKGGKNNSDLLTIGCNNTSMMLPTRIR